MKGTINPLLMLTQVVTIKKEGLAFMIRTILEFSQTTSGLAVSTTIRSQWAALKPLL